MDYKGISRYNLKSLYREQLVLEELESIKIEQTMQDILTIASNAGKVDIALEYRTKLLDSRMPWVSISGVKSNERVISDLVEAYAKLYPDNVKKETTSDDNK